MYNWQQKDWPKFKYDIAAVTNHLLAFAEQTGHVTAILDTIPEEKKLEIILNTMITEAVKTSEIEGEYLSRLDVASSIRNNLGLDTTHKPVKDKQAQGVGELMVHVRKTYADKMTEEELFAWHNMLFTGNTTILAIGKWRSHEAPMQVVSGALGKEKIHFEAPPSNKVAGEMEQFIKWFNSTAPGGATEIGKAPVRSAIAHLYFETIHPFEDGNGRIGRAIAEKALSQTLGRPVVLSLSGIIEAGKQEYYAALKTAQKENDITGWIKYFVKVVLDAQVYARELVKFTLKKAEFFNQFGTMLNDRQLKVIKKMLDAGPGGFEGGMSTKRYISITKASKATATRDLQELLRSEALIVIGAGRNTHYKLDI